MLALIDVIKKFRGVLKNKTEVHRTHKTFEPEFIMYSLYFNLLIESILFVKLQLVFIAFNKKQV